MSRRTWITWGASGALALGLAGCGLGTPASSSNPVLATVNGKAITTADWKSTMAALSVMQGQAVPTTQAYEKNQVQQLAIWSALEQWALQHHLTTAAKAAKGATSLYTQFETSAGGPKAFSASLQKYHLTKSTFMKFLTQQEVLQAAFNQVVKNIPAPTTQAIQSYYNTNKSLFQQPASDQLRVIVVKTNSEAQKLASELKTGQASFAALAKKYSLDPTSAKAGGQVGTVSQSSSGGAPPSLLQVMDALQAGQYGVAKVGNEYYVLEVEKVNPASTAPLNAVKAQIASQLTQTNDSQAFQAFGTQLESRDHVHIHVK